MSPAQGVATATHPRYLGRTVEWGHWGLTFMERQPDLLKNFGVIVGQLPFPVGARGPISGTFGSAQRQEFLAACDVWIERGETPAGFVPAEPGSPREPAPVDYRARYEALRDMIVNDRDAVRQDKVIHVCSGPAYQSWHVGLYFPDPLPQDYDRSDLDRVRLPLGEAVDRFVDELVNHAQASAERGTT